MRETLRERCYRIMRAWVNEQVAGDFLSPVWTDGTVVYYYNTALVVVVNDQLHVNYCVTVGEQGWVADMIRTWLGNMRVRHIVIHSRLAWQDVTNSPIRTLRPAVDAPEAPMALDGPAFRSPDVSLGLFDRLRSAMPE